MRLFSMVEVLQAQKLSRWLFGLVVCLSFAISTTSTPSFLLISFDSVDDGCLLEIEFAARSISNQFALLLPL